ncbi:hypothetical protein Y032_0002g709 [Ancylostoma ceylanicum]|uniref:Uncharacterized protein n=1 Tax=Ancylostoma ceylanicum TaxID=53326 RepID=A0A016W0B3_9BILA|nr:hypothetical protein Y032_0002g709 [Ancylostoma ceylanicum]
MSYNGYNWPCESYNANGQPRQQLYEGQQVRDWVNAYLTSAEAAPKSDWVNEYLTPARTPLPEVGQPARKEVQQGYFREHDRVNQYLASRLVPTADVRSLCEQIQEVQNPKESEWVNGNLPPTKVPLLGSIEANCEGAQQEPYFIAKQRNHHGPDQRE